MWQKLTQSLGTESSAPGTSANATTAPTGSAPTTTESTRPTLKVPTLASLKKTNDQVKGWINANNPFQNDRRRQDRVSTVVVNDESDNTVSPPAASRGLRNSQTAAPAPNAPPPPLTATVGTLPLLSPSKRGETTPQRRASEPVPSVKPPPYTPSSPSKGAQKPVEKGTNVARHPVQQGPRDAAAAPRKDTSTPPPPYSVFARLTDEPGGEPKNVSPLVKPPTATTDTTAAVRQSQTSPNKAGGGEGPTADDDYKANMDEYFDDFFGADGGLLGNDIGDPLSPLLRDSAHTRQSRSTKASVNSWYRPDSASRVSGGPADDTDNSVNTPLCESSRQGSAPAPARRQPLGREESDAAKNYPAFSVFRRTAVKRRTDREDGQSSHDNGRADAKPTLSSTASESGGGLQRTNDLAPSKWAYVALFATKLQEARATKLLASRLNRLHKTTDAKPDHTVEPSVFALGRVPSEGDSVDDVGSEEEVEVSAVWDDNGQPMPEPTMSMLWQDYSSSVASDAALTDHSGHSGNGDDFRAEESGGFTYDNAPSMFPATRHERRTSTSPKQTDHTPPPAPAQPTSPGGRMTRPAQSGARQQPGRPPYTNPATANGQTPFVRPQLQAAMIAQQQQKQQQQLWQQQQQQQQWGGGSPQARYQQQQQQQQMYGRPTATPAPLFTPSPPKSASPQIQANSAGQNNLNGPGAQRYHRQQQQMAPLQGPAPGVPMMKAEQRPAGGQASPGYVGNFHFVPQIPPPDPQPDIRGPKRSGRRPPPADFARLYGWRLSDARWVDSPTAPPNLGVAPDRSHGQYNVKNGVDGRAGHRRQR